MTTYNLADLFETVADTVPDREAIITEDRRLTFGELEQRANRLANFLRSRGVKAGDHIGLHLRNSNEYIEGMLAAYKLRAVPININYNYVETELKYLYDDADLVALVVQREFVPQVVAVAPDVPKLTTYVVVDDGSEASAPIGWTEYESSLAESSPGRDFEARSADI